MNLKYSKIISRELDIPSDQVSATVTLLDSGSTIPFISRYRKEATGNLDEVQVMNIRDCLSDLVTIDKRRAVILKSVLDQGKLTEGLKIKILEAKSLVILEDLYLPYKPKRRTKATVAKEKGLEPLAKMIFDQKGMDLEKEALEFVSKDKGVESIEEAIKGARDIIAEWVSEDAIIREKLRGLFRSEGVVYSKVIKGKEADASKFRDYFAYTEFAKNIPSHRFLAIRRGEKETFLSLRILPDERQAILILENHFVHSNGADSREVRMAIHDSFKRLLLPSLETKIRLEIKKIADLEAIDVFKRNFRNLLMAAPVGEKIVLAIDPGLRTGCKVVVLNAQGKILCHDIVYLSGSDYQKEAAKKTLKDFIKKYGVQFIAVGNGTAGRETETFVRMLGIDKSIQIVLVNESGASIYSASEVAREEFPDLDLTVRSAVSIGRRLMDPLAELVKIDAKSIGVGQYQHDVDQNLLKKSLDDVVQSCVNNVGVEINTASKELLTYVSGLGVIRAQAIIDYRNKSGSFKSRQDLLKVEGLGAKAIEQAIGFLRICGGDNPLDASAVHIESYGIVDQMSKDLGHEIPDLIGNQDLCNTINLKKYVTETVGLLTLEDIRDELSKPGRDPREKFEVFNFKKGVEHIDDLREGMILPGIVTNVTAFGAFVDIGVHQDGLVHISEISDTYVKDPNTVVKVQQKLSVKVLEIDKERGRIALSNKKTSK